MKKKSDTNFKSLLFVICIIIAVAFLIQLGVDAFQLDSPTGAAITVYELKDTLASIIGPPTTGTKIVTGANPTQTASKIADFLASDYVLCGNSQIDAGEDCEPSIIFSNTEGVIISIKCGNCKFIGDGHATNVDSQTGLMEECDPGAVDFIPLIAPVNSCSNNGVCQTDGKCPAGTHSTNLCRYGIYAAIPAGTVSYPYRYAAGNTICESGESASSFDCANPRMECGVSMLEESLAEGGSRDEVINGFAQEYGMPADFARAVLDAKSIRTQHDALLSDDSVFTLYATNHSNSSILLGFLDLMYSNSLYNNPIEGVRVYISTSSTDWIWYVGNILFRLNLYEGYGVPALTLQQKVAGNAVLSAYLTHFGSDVPPPLGSVCGNNMIDSGEQCDDGNTNNGDGCSSTCQTEPATPLCGNNIVDFSEQCDDGNTNNGDGCSSTCQTEPATPACGDMICDSGETFTNCPSDCSPVCGDSLCEFGEGSFNCPSDCQPVCGNFICDVGENFLSCTADCPPSCGNQICEAVESNLVNGVRVCQYDCP